MIWSWKKNRIEGLVAASLYERLSDKEQRELDDALRSDPALASEYEALQGMVASIPSSPLQSHPDLLPLINKRLNAPERARSSYRTVYAGIAAVFLAVLSLAAWFAIPSTTESVTSPSPTSSADRSLMAQSLAEADVLLAKRDLAGAYESLRKALSRQPADPLAGEAQWRVADLAFEMKRYPEALEAYSALLNTYRESLESASNERKSGAIDRHMLLDEAEPLQFASLHAYDAAIRDRGNAFVALEDVIARYQGQSQYEICDRAAFEMAQIVSRDVQDSGAQPLAVASAYEAARGRCTSPVAAALFDLKTGDVYRDALKDYAKAESHYQRAAENPVLAGRAKDALNRLASLKR